MPKHPTLLHVSLPGALEPMMYQLCRYIYIYMILIKNIDSFSIGGLLLCRLGAAASICSIDFIWFQRL